VSLLEEIRMLDDQNKRMLALLKDLLLADALHDGADPALLERLQALVREMTVPRATEGEG
jgi:hypothetical protein